MVDTALLGRQLVSVLGYLHRHGWVHLDVKPDNVVVQEGRAVLIDLGLATRPGTIERGMGTDGYAAPEQAAGGTVSAASDVWGLGATLAECVTGRAPGRTPDLRRVPAALRPLLEACLDADPARRPTLDQLRGRLDGAGGLGGGAVVQALAAPMSSTMTAPMTTSSETARMQVPMIPQIRPALVVDRPPS